MELWDAYLEDGTKAGKDLIRGEEIPEGLFHIVCEVLVRHVDGDFLLMQRDLGKATHAGDWEATAGGSALKGESPLDCIHREMEEETGLFGENFEQVGYEVYRHRGALFYCYFCEVDCDKAFVTLQKGETIAYRWLPESEFIRFVNSGEMIPGQKRRYDGYFRKMGYLR